MRLSLTSVLVAAAAVIGLGSGCGGDDGGTADAGSEPSIVVTSTILGDIVRNVVGDTAEVEVLLPAGADPHEFAPSVREAEAMADADLLVQHGAGFEAGLGEAVETAAEDGTPLFTVADHVELIGDDPHVWTDPSRLVPAVEALGARLEEVTGDAAALDRAAAYVGELEALDAEIEATVATIPPEDRVLVTNHEAFGYFAARYGFEVVGAVIPSLTTGAQPSAADIDTLAETIESERVRAIFAETTSTRDLAEALAETVGDVEVVSLYTESLGEPGSGAETYLGMLRTDAELIRDALT